MQVKASLNVVTRGEGSVFRLDGHRLIADMPQVPHHEFRPILAEVAEEEQAEVIDHITTHQVDRRQVGLIQPVSQRSIRPVQRCDGVEDVHFSLRGLHAQVPELADQFGLGEQHA